jgi:predicted nucleotidyltransferase component of viral defense system
MGNNHLKEWGKLSDSTKSEIFKQTSDAIGLPAVAVEKDWWVVNTLWVIFSSEYSKELVFKGGTSLSKGWNIIQRFSEDVDLALSREYLGFEGKLSKKEITKLRKASCNFITTTFYENLKSLFDEVGLPNVRINVIENKGSDDDPVKIEVAYESIVEQSEYLKSRVLIETGSRSLIEPFTNKKIATFVADTFGDKSFADTPIEIPIVNPERTLLEKIFLLHEEFQKPIDKIKVKRMSRHHYDIVKLMETDFASISFSDAELFATIVEHRRTMNKMRYVDYAKHAIGSINIIPPDEIINEWEKDYASMTESMIYDKSVPTFEELLRRVKEINSAINKR